MTPTNKFRFVERLHPHMAHQTVRVLQQWWAVGLNVIAQEPNRAGEGEWRDVPLEKEND